MMIVSDQRGFDAAWREQYENLARKFATLLRHNRGTLVEIGSGRGQLTIPLSRLIPNQIVAVDNYGPQYSTWHRAIVSVISKGKMKRRIRLVVSDYLDWLAKQESEKHSGIVSSEFLPDINSIAVRQLFSECYRILQLGGITIHSFLSPKGKNSRQRLSIVADSDPKWSRYPPEEWFSPPPSLVVRELRRTGFRKARHIQLKAGLTFRGAAAKLLLREWDVKEAFWRVHQDRLMSDGLEIPDWVIIFGQKAMNT